MTAPAKSSEVKLWAALVKEAKACALDPSRPPGDLFAVAARATKARFPDQSETGMATFFNLYNFARTFACCDLVGRQSNAKALAEKAAAADRLLKRDAPVNDPPPERPYRADIDG